MNSAPAAVEAFGMEAVKLGQRWHHAVVDKQHQKAGTVEVRSSLGYVTLAMDDGTVEVVSVGDLLAYWVRLS